MIEAKNKRRQFRKDAIAYTDIHGVVYINGMRYFLHSVTSAIAAYRKQFPIKRK